MRDPTRGPRAFRVGCWRRRVTAVLEEWLSRRRKAARQNPAYRLAPLFFAADRPVGNPPGPVPLHIAARLAAITLSKFPKSLFLHKCHSARYARVSPCPRRK